MNWNLIDKYGYDADLYTGWTSAPGPGHAGNKLAFELVTEAMKLQPTTPTFIEARDAILAADIALNGGEDQAEIWAAFARRGLGLNASTVDANSTVVTIDFSVPPQIFITAASPTIIEGDAGTSGATFTVSLSDPSTQAITVKYKTVNGTAKTSDNDYIGVSGTLTFAPGQTSKTFNVQVVGDTKFEQNETFTVVLSAPTKAFVTKSTSTAKVTIINDDAPPVPPGPTVVVTADTVVVATDGGVVAEVRAFNTTGSVVTHQAPAAGLVGSGGSLPSAM
jgi:hypothetical protein